jgi:hypothetical protein
MRSGTGSAASSRRPCLPDALRASRRELLVAAIVLVWIPCGLVADHGADIWRQRAVGAGTWLLLLALLRGERRGARAQVAVLVVAATCLEYSAAPLLGFYTYRLENVPSFVPPGHGLVYLAALCLARAPLLREREPAVLAVPVLGGGAWAAWGLFGAGRHDVGGALAFLLLLRFLSLGRAPRVYACAFVVTGYLELIGTALGTWAWAPRDPTGLLAMGNPPSGISGAYCILDATALALAPALLALGARLATLLRAPAPASQPSPS